MPTLLARRPRDGLRGADVKHRPVARGWQRRCHVLVHWHCRSDQQSLPLGLAEVSVA